MVLDKLGVLSIVAYDMLMEANDPKADGWATRDNEWVAYFINYDAVPGDTFTEEGETGISLLVSRKGNIADQVELKPTPEQHVKIVMSWVPDNYGTTHSPFPRHDWLGINLYAENIQLAERYRRDTQPIQETGPIHTSAG